MHYDYDTQRLLVRSLNDTYAPQVLAFYQKGREVFDAVEAAKSDTYYTIEHQEAQLRAEMRAFLSGIYARYFFMRKERPEEIIGTVSFSTIQGYPYNSAIIGYKVLPQYQHQGYATEAISCMINAFFTERRLHRLEAYVLPDNRPSINLLTRLGFSFECLASSVICLKNGYTDHCRYYLINPADQPR